MLKREKQKKYSKELKIEAIHAYLNGKGSLQKISQNTDLFNVSNSGNGFYGVMIIKKLKVASSAKGEIYITQGRKTTQEERAEIGWWGILKSEMYYLKNLRTEKILFPLLKITYIFTTLAVTVSV